MSTNHRIYTADEARALREAATAGPWRALLPAFGFVGVVSDSAVCGFPSNKSYNRANADIIAAAPDLAHTVEALHADLHRLRLTLACEQGRSHDEAGQPYPWTRAGWEWNEHDRSWQWFDDETLVSAMASPTHKTILRIEQDVDRDRLVRGDSKLDGIIRAHAALNLPPLEGL